MHFAMENPQALLGCIGGVILSWDLNAAERFGSVPIGLAARRISKREKASCHGHNDIILSLTLGTKNSIEAGSVGRGHLVSTDSPWRRRD